MKQEMISDTVSKPIPLDSCLECNGAGTCDGFPCYACNQTGYQYGEAAMNYAEEVMDLAFQWYELFLEILVDSYGFPERIFIPQDATTFLMNYFSKEGVAPPSKEILQQEMREELGLDFFETFRPLCFARTASTGRIFIYLSLMEAPQPTKEMNELDEQTRSDFRISASDAKAFMEYVQPDYLGGGVFSFSKSVWNDFPDTIHLDTQFTL